ncbi:MAG: hypothetical protein LBG64_00420 [Pseudomonadales bacterium]|jgi:hypothetical protein|nr:hypothetical protein [Pseudomonadales bacterium]
MSYIKISKWSVFLILIVVFAQSLWGAYQILFEASPIAVRALQVPNVQENVVLQGAIYLPRESVFTTEDGLDYVLVSRNGATYQRFVDAGVGLGNMVRVFGLDEGEFVIIDHGLDVGQEIHLHIINQEAGQSGTLI